ncbi:alpha/beta hydrolase [Clostridiaceae bacterium M8S5]|nr:alpha/beta hydrolase [Clostridiaceae bacterium M8S5]
MAKSIFKSNEGKKAIIKHYETTMELWPLPYEEEYINTRYGKTYVVKSGDIAKQPLILIHGSCSNSSMWIGDVLELSEHYYVIAIDIIGEAGKSDENRLNLKSDEYALWIKDILDSLNISKAIFMGNSLGGWMSLKFAITYPNRVSKLVLLATSGIAPAKISFLFRSITLLMMGERGFKKLNQIVYGSDDVPIEAIEASSLIANNFNPMVGALPVFTDEEMSKIKNPVLFIGGENDALLPTKKTSERLLKLLPKAKTKVIKDRGHVIFGVTKDIVKFLRE